MLLARLAEESGKTDDCLQRCQQLLRVNPGHEAACVMLSDIMFRRNEPESAMLHFQRLLEHNPAQFTALARLITLLKRAGKLTDVPRFLSMAQRSDPTVTHSAGFKFCQGLMYRYQNEPRQAIEHFNKARNHGHFSVAAIENMVEIYLNPENEDIWASSDDEVTAERADAYRIAEQLLREIPEAQRTKKHDVLRCYTYIVTKSRANLEQALAQLGEILESDMDYVPGLLALAVALMMLKQTPKARNQLKRIAKMQFTTQYCDEFVQSWLMLADIYNQSSKFDLAQELCKRALQYDGSSAKAWEYMGLIMEKEQSYADAASYYEQAWSFGNESVAAIGFKLGFNYLKAKRYVEAIDVCRQVIKKFPHYPKIHTEILSKAQASLRP